MGQEQFLVSWLSFQTKKLGTETRFCQKSPSCLFPSSPPPFLASSLPEPSAMPGTLQVFSKCQLLSVPFSPLSSFPMWAQGLNIYRQTHLDIKYDHQQWWMVTVYQLLQSLKLKNNTPLFLPATHLLKQIIFTKEYLSILSLFLILTRICKQKTLIQMSHSILVHCDACQYSRNAINPFVIAVIAISNSISFLDYS